MSNSNLSNKFKGLGSNSIKENSAVSMISDPASAEETKQSVTSKFNFANTYLQ